MTFFCVWVCVHAYEHVYDHVYAWSCMFYMDVHVYVHVFYRNNLHIVLCMSPVGNAFRTRCRMFPSLVNCCTIDWFVEWPREALLGVSKSFFESIDLGSDEIKVSAFLSNFWDLKEKANWFWMIDDSRSFHSKFWLAKQLFTITSTTQLQGGTSRLSCFVFEQCHQACLVQASHKFGYWNDIMDLGIMPYNFKPESGEEELLWECLPFLSNGAF